MSIKKEIERMLNHYDFEIHSVAGIGLDFKTIYINKKGDRSTCCGTLGGKDYKTILIKLREIVTNSLINNVPIRFN